MDTWRGRGEEEWARESERGHLPIASLTDGKRLRKTMRGSVGARPDPDISWQDHWVAPDATLDWRRRGRRRRPEEESKRGEEERHRQDKGQRIHVNGTKKKANFKQWERGERSKVKY